MNWRRGGEQVVEVAVLGAAWQRNLLLCFLKRNPASLVRTAHN